MRTGADEARSLKYSHVERERRFLVDPALLPPFPDRYVLIEDNYILGSRFRLRRMRDSATGEEALKLAKKYEADDPCARPTVTIYVTAEEYALFASLDSRMIVKRRHDVEWNGEIFSVDRFENTLAGLILAEIERPTAAALASVSMPDWAIRDVSFDPRYEGGHLAHLQPDDVHALLA